MISRFNPRFGWINYPYARSVISFVIYLFFSPHQSHVFTHVIILTSVAVAFFYGSVSVLEGKPEEAPSRIKAVRSSVLPSNFSSSDVLQAYVPTIIRNWCVLTDPQWRLLISLFRGVYIPTQLINFSIVPPHLRFFTVSVVSLFWSKRLTFRHSAILILHQIPT